MAAMMKRLERQQMIRELIDRQNIGSQEELLERLRQSGVEVTQPTLSRDLVELGAAKVSDGKHSYYRIESENSHLQAVGKILPLEIISIESNEYVVLIKTVVGRAQGVAWYIDRMELNDILGTIAGDDVIMVVPRTVKKIKNVIKLLEMLKQGEFDVDAKN